MNPVCKYCKQELSYWFMCFLKGMPGTYSNDSIFCPTFLATHPDYHSPMDNLEYCVWLNDQNKYKQCKESNSRTA